MNFTEIVIPNFVNEFTLGDLIAFSLVPISVYGGYRLGRWLKSPVQKVEEENQKTAYKSIFYSIYQFDMAFRHFYLSFEGYFLPIRELEPKFLPLEPAKMIRTRTTAQGVKKENFTVTFEDFKNDENSFKWMLDIMTTHQKNLKETLKITRNMMPVIFYNLLNNYVEMTMEYMKYFSNGQNNTTCLQFRLMYAESILFQLEQCKLSNENSHIQNFVKRWKEYVESEKN